MGANAVNGVINIISKDAADTQGGLLTAGTGTEERGLCSVRYGGRVGDTAHFRVHGKVANRDGFVDADGVGTAGGRAAAVSGSTGSPPNGAS